MKVFLVELEPVEIDTTPQWKQHLPMQMKDAGLDVVVIEGPRRCSRYYTWCILKLQWY